MLHKPGLGPPAPAGTARSLCNRWSTRRRAGGRESALVYCPRPTAGAGGLMTAPSQCSTSLPFRTRNTSKVNTSYLFASSCAGVAVHPASGCITRLRAESPASSLRVGCPARRSSGQSTVWPGCVPHPNPSDGRRSVTMRIRWSAGFRPGLPVMTTTSPGFSVSRVTPCPPS